MTREPTKKTRTRGESTRPRVRGRANKLEREAQRDWRTQSRGFIRAIGRWLRSAVVDNLALKLVALVLSITLFVVVNTNRDAVISVPVGISYTMPSDRVLISQPVNQVRLTIKGTWRRIKRFDERELGRIDVDLRGVRAREYTFSAGQIGLPDGIRLLSIDPPSIPLSFEKLAKKTVPVSVPRIGHPATGYEVASVVAKPTQIAVRGAESEINALASIDTSEIDLTGKRQTFDLSLPLLPPRPAPIIQLLDSNPVEVVVTIAEKLSTRKIESLAIVIVGADGVEPTALGQAFTIEPKTVDVVLHGPQLTVDGFQGPLEAHVEIHAEDAEGGQRKAPVFVVNTPEGVGVQVLPPTVLLSSKVVE